jgi:hypothetical protein
MMVEVRSEPCSGFTEIVDNDLLDCAAVDKNGGRIE